MKRVEDTVVLTYGTFDLLHFGHIRLLKRAKELGTCLIVGLSTDDFNRQKQKDAFIPYAHRKEVLESVKYVDHVFPEDAWEQKEDDIARFGADIFVMGSDWGGKFDHLQGFCKVVYLDRTDNISTTELKTSFRNK